MEDRILISDFIDSVKDEIIETAKKIWNYKELSQKEYRSSKLLQNILKKHGFEVIDGIAGLDTAFEASFNKNKGVHKIAFFGEYDALPCVGHGCGHNLIGAASLGAALGFAQIAERTGSEVYMFGTPAEETIGGKIKMLDAGCFDNLDFVLMFHPSCLNSVSGDSLAISAFDIEFRGKPAHASADPFNGKNALDGLINLYNSIAMIRQQLRSDARIHFIIRNGGQALNIIPEKATGEIALRATDRKYLELLTKKLKTLAKASASATFTKSRLKKSMPTYYEMVQDPVLAETFIQTSKEYGITDFSYRINAGSVDIGNVSHIIPSLHAYLKIADEDVPGHSREFADASKSDKAMGIMLKASKIMAVTALKVVRDKNLLEQLKNKQKDQQAY